MSKYVNYHKAVKDKDPEICKIYLDNAIAHFDDRQEDYHLVKRIAEVAINCGYWQAIRDSESVFETAVKEMRKNSK